MRICANEGKRKGFGTEVEKNCAASSLLLHLSNGLELLREIVLMYVMIERDGKKVY